MTTQVKPIVVGIDSSPGSATALQWALDEARSRNLPVQVISAYPDDRVMTPEIAVFPGMTELSAMPKRAAEELVETALHDIRHGKDRVVARGAALQGDPVDVLSRESTSAAIVVIGSRHLGPAGSFFLGSVGGGVAARSFCSVVVTRGPAGMADERARVVAAVEPSELSEAVLDFAFAEASWHGVPLRAVMCWHPSIASASGWLESAAIRSREQAEAWMGELLAGWQERYPDVEVARVIRDDHPVAGLVKDSWAQNLLVVGRRTHRAESAALLGSVSQGVLHHATCPVAVVGTASAHG